MVCHYKRYSTFTFILPISFSDAKFNFPYLRIYQFFRIFCLYEPPPHFIFVLFKITLVRTQSTYAQSLAKNYRTFSVVWWVDFTCNTIFPSFNSTLRSRNGIFYTLHLGVSFIYWLKLLSSFENFWRLSSPRDQMKKTSSIYRKHTKGCKNWRSSNLISRSFMKIDAYDGANLVPIAVAEICF